MSRGFWESTLPGSGATKLYDVGRSNKRMRTEADVTLPFGSQGRISLNPILAPPVTPRTSYLSISPKPAISFGDEFGSHVGAKVNRVEGSANEDESMLLNFTVSNRVHAVDRSLRLHVGGLVFFSARSETHAKQTVSTLMLPYLMAKLNEWKTEVGKPNPPGPDNLSVLDRYRLAGCLVTDSGVRSELGAGMPMTAGTFHGSGSSAFQDASIGVGPRGAHELDQYWTGKRAEVPGMYLFLVFRTLRVATTVHQSGQVVKLEFHLGDEYDDVNPEHVPEQQCADYDTAKDPNYMRPTYLDNDVEPPVVIPVARVLHIVRPAKAGAKVTQENIGKWMNDYTQCANLDTIEKLTKKLGKLKVRMILGSAKNRIPRNEDTSFIDNEPDLSFASRGIVPAAAGAAFLQQLQQLQQQQPQQQQQQQQQQQPVRNKGTGKKAQSSAPASASASGSGSAGGAAAARTPGTYEAQLGQIEASIKAQAVDLTQQSGQIQNPIVVAWLSLFEAYMAEYASEAQIYLGNLDQAYRTLYLNHFASLDPTSGGGGSVGSAVGSTISAATTGVVDTTESAIDIAASSVSTAASAAGRATSALTGKKKAKAPKATRQPAGTDAPMD